MFSSTPRKSINRPRRRRTEGSRKRALWRGCRTRGRHSLVWLVKSPAAAEDPNGRIPQHPCESRSPGLQVLPFGFGVNEDFRRNGKLIEIPAQRPAFKRLRVTVHDRHQIQIASDPPVPAGVRPEISRPSEAWKPLPRLLRPSSRGAVNDTAIRLFLKRANSRISAA